MNPVLHLTGVSFHHIAQLSALRIVDCLVEGTLVAFFAGLLLRMARRVNSATRFSMWFCALLAVAVSPLLGAMLGSMGRANEAAQSSALARPEFTLPVAWAFWLFAIWAVAAAVGVARVVIGLWRLRGLRRSCVAVDLKSLDPGIRAILSRSSSKAELQLSGLANRKSRSAVLCVSDAVSVPTAIGFIRPAVVMPRWLMNELSPSELKQVLLHELAHLHRWDDWTNLAQKLLKALLFFHPAVWWIEKQLSLEREMACDDAVLAETADPRAYAECLTHLAEKSFVRRSLALAQAALGRIRQTSLRVAQILDAEQQATPKHSWKPATAAVAGFAVICTIAFSRAPRLVGFENRQVGFEEKQAFSSRRSSRMTGSQIAASQIASEHIALSPIADSVGRTDSPSTLPVQLLAYRPANRADSSMRVQPTKTRLNHQRPHAVLAKSIPQGLPQEVEVAPGSSSPAESLPNESLLAAGWSVGIINASAAISAPSAVGSNLVFVTDFVNGETPITETLFVVVEGRGPGPSAVPAYRISVWRIMLRAPADAAHASTIPHKET